MNDNNAADKPLFHRRIIIFLGTLFLTAFFGGILYCQNLYQADKRKEIPPVIIGCMLWSFLSGEVLTYLCIQDSTERLFIPSIISAIVLSTVVWNYHFKQVKEYQFRKLWSPLAAILLVYGTLLAVYLLARI